jgi:hypothetical protein
MEIKIWTGNLPEKEGFYWFYGRRFRDDYIKLRTVKVHKIGNSYIYDGTGAGFIQSETVGYWQEITPPDITNLYFPKEL